MNHETHVTDWSEHQPIEAVADGMDVVDATGERIGTVALIEMGDPGAATSEGNRLQDQGILSDLGIALVGDVREPDVDSGARPLLLRVGFVKIDVRGLFARDLYARGDQVAAVEGKTVHLSATRDELFEAGGEQ